jgi:hypothetical protein
MVVRYTSVQQKRRSFTRVSLQRLELIGSLHDNYARPFNFLDLLRDVRNIFHEETFMCDKQHLDGIQKAQSS